MNIKHLMLGCVSVTMLSACMGANADGFALVKERTHAQLKSEGYPESTISHMMNRDTPAINQLRNYLKSSCLSYTNTSGSGGVGGNYVGSNQNDSIAFFADGTFTGRSSSSVYISGGVNGSSKGGESFKGYWNIFQGSTGNMILVMSGENGGISISFITSYDAGALSSIPSGESIKTLWRRTANSSC